jgi:alpha-L-fucosidase
MKTTLIALLTLAAVTGRAAEPVDMAKRTEELKNLRWGMFVSWSFSTFSGKQWTRNATNINLFAAKDCDTDQWARTAKEAGMGYILFLTKHHDGFCLWDTKTTDRKVTKAPLGRDVLAELKKSCDKYGIKLALYFSEAEFSEHKTYHPGGYTPQMQKAQLTELLTQYGPVEYLWIDHAIGTGGMSHAELIAFVKALQPGCFVGFNNGVQEGADIRLGEIGRPGPLSDQEAAGPYMRQPAAASYRLAEFTYPIQPLHKGEALWFYLSPELDNLCLPAEKLYADYLGAVKYGNIFSIAVGPDHNGKLRAIDVATLRKVGEMIRNQPISEWRQDKFMIAAYGGPITEAQAAAYAEAKFNTVMTKADQLDLCAKHGLRSIVMDVTPEKARNLKDHPAVWGWFVKDEPSPKEFATIAPTVEAFHKVDPNRPAYVNLVAWEDLDVYFKTVKPRFLSYDYYQWWWKRGHLCGTLERHRVAALKAGVPYFCWVESDADWRWEKGVARPMYLPDNAAMLRNSVWLALAHGVRGIQWFTGALVIDKDGKRTRSGEDVAAINRELEALGPVLMTLNSEKVYHTDPVPDKSVKALPDFEFTSPSRDLTFGVFSGPDNLRHVIVVNREVKVGAATANVMLSRLVESLVVVAGEPDAKAVNAERNVDVRFKLPYEVERFNTTTGKWNRVKVRKKDSLYSISLHLPSGGGTLLRCRASAP